MIRHRRYEFLHSTGNISSQDEIKITNLIEPIGHGNHQIVPTPQNARKPRLKYIKQADKA
jgi:hypothetical protein